MNKKPTQQCIQDFIINIEYPQVVIDFVVKNEAKIIDNWGNYPTIFEIKKQLNFSDQEYKEQLSSKVVEYFITLLYKLNQPGDCPAMREIVNKFVSLGLKVEDVFTNCSALKNTIINLFLETNNKELLDNLENILLVLDYNLNNVLAIYSDIKREQEKALQFKHNIIEENVLYTKTDNDGVILEITDAFSKLTGYPKEELLGKTHAILRHPNTDDETYKDLWSTIKNGNIWIGTIPNIKKDGTFFISNLKIVPVLDDNKLPKEYLAFRHDVTSTELLKHDSLTNLYNRRTFDAEFEKLCQEATLRTSPLSLIIIDIDYFKNINDNYGHSRGDDILIALSNILLNYTRLTDVCARWGGEEFVIILPGSTKKKAVEIAERIRVYIESNLAIDGEYITCSFGVAQKRIHEASHELFNRADDYLYKAKRNGRNQVVSD